MTDEKNQDLDSRVGVAKIIANTASKQITEHFHASLRAEEKQANDFVTELDENIEKMALNTVKKRFPKDGFYGEETSSIKSENGYEWVVDPLDGTNNFVRGLPLCGFQLAIIKDEVPLYSIICRPLTHEIYTAKKGAGAYYKNTRTSEYRKLEVSTRPLRNAVAVFDTKVGKLNNPSTEVFNRIADRIAMIRVFGVAVFDLPAVAEGSVELLVTGIAQKYDIAPGLLLIEESGGQQYSITGDKSNLNDSLMVLSNGAIKEELLNLLTK